MHTTFFNVGHGEAIFIDLQNNERIGIVRDLGRSRFAKHTDFSMSLPRLLKGPCFPPAQFPHWPPMQCDAILSHAHEDHFNGFQMLYDDTLGKLFQNAYIPWLRMTDLQALGGILIKYSLLLYRYYGPQDYRGANAKHWLMAAPIMAALSQRLWCVSAGHHVESWPTANTILWPPPPSCGKQEEKKLRCYWSEYLRNNAYSEDFMESEAEDIRKC